MATRIVKRNTCRLCLSQNVAVVVKLDPVPLAEKYTSTSEAAKAAERYPIDLYMCGDCGHVQVLDVIDSDTLWDDYTYFSGQTKGIIDHFKDIAANVISKYQPPANGLVMDVGSNDGSLLRPFKDSGLRVVGVDPAKEIAAQATASGIPTIAGLMTMEIADRIVAEHGKASVVTAFNVFAHADDLGGMAECIRTMLAPDGVFVFECQYLLDIIDKFLLGTIFHEHMSHHSLKPMVKFLASHGMELIDVQRNNIQKGSIVGTAQLIGGKRPQAQSVKDLLALEEERRIDRPEALEPFNGRLNHIRAQFASFIQDCTKRGARIAAYGAARSGPTFTAQFGMGDAIECIFDDHPQKTHKYSPGDGTLVVPTSELYSRKPDYVVILAWIHATKIIEQHRKYLEQGGKFIVCCPNFEVIDASSTTQRIAACTTVS